MKKLYFLLLSFLISTASFGQSTVYFSEIHYDNTGSDVDEGFEIAGTAGTDLAGYFVQLYNGSNGTMYDTIDLSGTLTDQGDGLGYIWFDVSTMQNGAPDGLALMNSDNNVLQFISYEGALTATNGFAIGMTSTDIGVYQQSSTEIGLTLQFNGTDWFGPISSTIGAASDATLSVVENQIEGFSMYPNPAVDGSFTITSKSNTVKQVEIYSLLGNLVVSKSVKSNEKIDVSNLSSGFYMVKVEEEGKIATRKLLVK